MAYVISHGPLNIVNTKYVFTDSMNTGMNEVVE